MGFWRIKGWWSTPACARLGGGEQNHSRRRFIDIDALTPLITAAGRSLDHARCSHSTFFEPDVYKTHSKLIFQMFSNIIKNHQNAIKLFSQMLYILWWSYDFLSNPQNYTNQLFWKCQKSTFPFLDPPNRCLTFMISKILDFGLFIFSIVLCHTLGSFC